ncbi:MAG: mechanosensitive ion channel family protein, partial [Myxococcales bacterium]|nr:mechanosensitive ion channel family protein [Myxococcales bacterium]
SQDIKAVRRRLNSLALQQSRQATKPSPKKRSSTKVNGRSPYAEYKAELSQILSDKARLEERRKEVRANHELVTAQLASMNILSKAQSTDLSLFEREVSIISEELRRIENAPLERRAAKLPLVRDWSWLAIWRHYEAKANGKRDKLTGALRDTQSSIDSLHSDASVFQFESKDLARSIAIAQRKASNLANQRNRYLWRTALYWLRANAWQIPLFLLGAWILLWITRRIGDSMVERAKTRRKFIEDRDAMQQLETLVKVTRGVARLVIYLAALLGIVASLGVNISPILGAGAIFGLAISFGSQNLVRDVVTGFFILLENQYAVGDVVTIGGVTGGVEQITLRRTVVRGLDGTLHNIPNGSVSLVSNKTQGWSRALIHVGVGYESDLALVEEVANRVGTSLWDDEKWRWQLLEEAPKYIGLTELGDSALVVRVMGKTITGQQWDVERELMKRLKEAFDEAGINIPFPQRDLHLKLVPEAKILEIAKPPKEKA